MSLTNIDLRAARHITGLARHLNFTRAARELELTQSALSRSIQHVEAALGVTLFDRDRTKVQLTAMGRIVVDGANALLQQSQSFDELLGRLKAGAQTSVRFGMARTAAAALLPQALQAELELAPGLQHQVVVRSFDNLRDMLLAREIEFFVSAEHRREGSAANDTLQVHPIANFPIVPLVRAGHPLLAPHTGKRPDDFPWMISSTEAPATTAQDMGYPQLRPTPEIMLEDLGCAARLTATTDLIWVTSTFSAARELQEGRLRQLTSARQHRTPARPPYKLMIFQLHGCTLSPAALRVGRRFAVLASRLQETI